MLACLDGHRRLDARAGRVPGTHAAGRSDPRATGSPTDDEVGDDGDDCRDQQQVDGEDGDVEGQKAQQPQDEQNSSDGKDHDDLL